MLLDPPMELGLYSPPMGVSREGRKHQVLIHLSILEDFSTQVIRIPSGGRSKSLGEHEEEYPRQEHFFWMAGAPDGVEWRPRRLPTDAHSWLGPRRDDRDDDHDDRAGHA